VTTDDRVFAVDLVLLLLRPIRSVVGDVPREGEERAAVGQAEQGAS
jgi:hypothetical protein